MSITHDDVRLLLQGLGVTVLMIVLAGSGSLLVGVMVTVARISPVPLLRAAAFAYVQFFINVPLLALLILSVFALPEAGLILPVTPTVVAVLALYQAAYVAEALRSGVNTVDRGQVEAARALGLNLRKTLRHVVVPQALRAVVQPIGNQMIALTMNSALAAIVGVVELTSRINSVNLTYAQPILFYTGGGLAYMALALLIGLATGRIERRVAIVR